MPPCSCLGESPNSTSVPHFGYGLTLCLGEASALGSVSLAKHVVPIILWGCGIAVNIRATEAELTMLSGKPLLGSVAWSQSLGYLRQCLLWATRE